jgi:hypothetical protein
MEVSTIPDPILISDQGCVTIDLGILAPGTIVEFNVTGDVNFDFLVFDSQGLPVYDNDQNYRSATYWEEETVFEDMVGSAIWHWMVPENKQERNWYVVIDNLAHYGDEGQGAQGGSSLQVSLDFWFSAVDNYPEGDAWLLLELKSWEGNDSDIWDNDESPPDPQFRVCVDADGSNIDCFNSPTWDNNWTLGAVWNLTFDIPDGSSIINLTIECEDNDVLNDDECDMNPIEGEWKLYFEFNWATTTQADFSGDGRLDNDTSWREAASNWSISVTSLEEINALTPPIASVTAEEHPLYPDSLEDHGTKESGGLNWPVYLAKLSASGDVKVKFDACGSYDPDAMNGESGITTYTWKVYQDYPWNNPSNDYDGHTFERTAAMGCDWTYTFYNQTADPSGFAENPIRIELEVIDRAGRDSEKVKMYFVVVPEDYGDDQPVWEINTPLDGSTQTGEYVWINGTILSGSENGDVAIEAALDTSILDGTIDNKVQQLRDGKYVDVRNLRDGDSFVMQLKIDDLFTTQSRTETVFLKIVEGDGQTWTLYESININLPAAQEELQEDQEFQDEPGGGEGASFSDSTQGVSFMATCLLPSCIALLLFGLFIYYMNNRKKESHQQSMRFHQKYQQPRATIPLPSPEFILLQQQRNQLQDVMTKHQQEKSTLHQQLQSQQGMTQSQLSEMQAEIEQLTAKLDSEAAEKARIESELKDEKGKSQTVVQHITYNIQDSAIAGDINATGLKEKDD